MCETRHFASGVWTDLEKQIFGRGKYGTHRPVDELTPGSMFLASRIFLFYFVCFHLFFVVLHNKTVWEKMLIIWPAKSTEWTDTRIADKDSLYINVCLLIVFTLVHKANRIWTDTRIADKDSSYINVCLLIVFTLVHKANRIWSIKCER